MLSFIIHSLRPCRYRAGSVTGQPGYGLLNNDMQEPDLTPLGLLISMAVTLCRHDSTWILGRDVRDLIKLRLKGVAYGG
jgi:hypothetical protein